MKSCILLLLLVAVVVADLPCPRVMCIGANETCKGDLYTEDCRTGCCPIDFYCNNGACVTNTDGSDCQLASDCKNDLWGTGMTGCINNKCTQLMDAGDKCSVTNSNCAYNMKCVNGKCSPMSANQSCSSNAGFGLPAWNIIGQDCAYGYYCDPTTKLCTKTLNEGDDCNPSKTPICGMGLVCDGVNKKCVSMFSSPLGVACRLDTPYTCNANLYCRADNVSPQVGTCQQGTSDEYTTCTTDVDCTGTENRTCMCMPYDGLKYCTQLQQAPCPTFLKSVYDCISQNKCTTGVISQNTASCSQINCANEIDAYRSCLLCDQFDLSTCLAPSEDQEYCD